MYPHELPGGRVLPIGDSHDVRVACPRQSPIRRLDLLARGARVDAKDLVERGARSGHVRRRATVSCGSGSEGERRGESELCGWFCGEDWCDKNCRGRNREHGPVRRGAVVTVIEPESGFGSRV